MSDVWLLLQEFSVYTYIVTNSTRVGVTNSIYMIESHGCLACSGSLRYSLHIHTYARTAHVTESRTPYMIESHGFLACYGSLMYFLGLSHKFHWITNSIYDWVSWISGVSHKFHLHLRRIHYLHIRMRHELLIQMGSNCSWHRGWVYIHMDESRTPFKMESRIADLSQRLKMLQAYVYIQMHD